MSIALNERLQESGAFSQDALWGLSRHQKSIPSRWLYDDRGSELFEKITQIDEYYPTRTEISILARHAEEIAVFCGKNAVLIEYGAGAATKTEILIEALEAPQFYAPIDIAGDFLHRSLTRLGKRYSQLRSRGIIADFTALPSLPAWVPAGRRVAFFPGSTLGNLDATQALQFLRCMRRHVGANGCAIIGVDMKKPLSLLIPAYDDAAGVTAEFNLNLLRRMNRELDADFALDAFAHSARWNVRESAIEMHLVSRHRHSVVVAGQRFAFDSHETIHTESSRKYDREDFGKLVHATGWSLARQWSDSGGLFSIFGLE
ncbi:MAG TPA: L-histidine N(alpha)-methyltransferase [Steroidobacteraceae bacterium]|nr:L-histidine N(alpha)-methyltransferase [Steroidobacteraceae bacterium]